jgi:SAM-dependent methyltransferase
MAHTLATLSAENIMPSHRIENIKRKTPWFVKIPAKIVLSRIPIGARRWQRLDLFKAGMMDDPASAFGLFRKHLEGGKLADLTGRQVLELGPGNSALTALFARSFGAARTWLVDAEELASQDMALFLEAEKMLAQFGLPVPGVGTAASVNAALRQLNAEYLTSGLASLQRIPDGQVDFLFSNAVLEHIRLAEFAPLAREMRRVLKPDGVASHQIDFRDHLEEGLNNLRFSERVWESNFMARSGFYTNRLPWPSMKQIFKNAGLSVEMRAIQPWPKGLPTRQSRMAVPFKNMPVEQLMIMGAHVVLRRK